MNTFVLFYVRSLNMTGRDKILKKKKSIIKK